MLKPNLLELLLSSTSFRSFNEESLNSFARSYNILDYPHSLKTILRSILPEYELNNFSKFQLHKLINRILIDSYKGESSLKSKLVDMFIEQDVIAAFEISVNKSRADFIAINGDTKSFEIKSGIDNLNKLAKQISDYEKVFEFNYIVVDERHIRLAIDLLPSHYGVYIIENEKLFKLKAAQNNYCLDPEMQLQLFTKKEIEFHFEVNCSNDINLANITKSFDSCQINKIFKAMLKKRYEKKWTFLKQNCGNILPIDYQYFFRHNISPHIIYGT